MKFRILIGCHSENGKFYASKKTQKSAKLEHVEGDIIETDNDLKVHNSPWSIKFVKLENEDEVSTPLLVDEDGTPDFDAMSLKDMKEFAAENEIELGGATKKEDIYLVLKQAWGDD